MQSQGWEDSYTILDNLVLKGGEYAAKYNLGYDVPYDRSFYRCEAILVKGPWAQPSEIKRGIVGSPKVWDVSNTLTVAGNSSTQHPRRQSFLTVWVSHADMSCQQTRSCTISTMLREG